MDLIPRADHDAAVAEARTAAAGAERERIASILGSEAAKSRPAAALKIAMMADVTPALAAGLLEGINPEAPAANFRFDGQRSQDAPGGLALVDTASAQRLRKKRRRHGLPGGEGRHRQKLYRAANDRAERSRPAHPSLVDRRAAVERCRVRFFSGRAGGDLGLIVDQLVFDARLISMIEAEELTLTAIDFWMQRIELRAEKTSRRRKFKVPNG